ncbi:hypothetical protein BGZ75_010003 [Mortierella antarctica]|nr:hypothetical protein BGZ75_010003 [Mortierella antarctica]
MATQTSFEDLHAPHQDAQVSLDHGHNQDHSLDQPAQQALANGQASTPSGVVASGCKAASRTIDKVGMGYGAQSRMLENGGSSAGAAASASASVERAPPSAQSIAVHRPSSAQHPMDTTQPDLMTMEAFQMHNGAAVDYDTQDITGHSYLPGPGTFPDTFGSNGAYNHDVGPLEKDSTHSSDSEDALGASISFVYANERRFSDFHALFRSVPDEEKLIEDYGCALQKEILVQGRLYISENHVCFNANIFGWVTNLVIAFSDITAIEKRLTAFVIPNAISIVTATNTKGHFFASFLSRDAAHDLLMAAWRKSFPCAANASAINNNVYFRSNRSNASLNEDDDDADSFTSARAASDSRRNRHRRSSSSSQNWTADEADWDETEDMDGKSTTGSRTRNSKRATVKKILKAVPNNTAEGNRTGRSRSVSELPPKPASFGHSRRDSVGSNLSDEGDDASAPPGKVRDGSKSLPNSHSGQGNGHKPTNGDVNGSLDRSPTTCKCSNDSRHYANTFMTQTYPGSVKSMWELLFDSDFSKGFLTNEAMKGADVQEEPWQKAADGTSTKVTKYIKWLGMPIGPKTTKAILTDVCESKDFDDYVTTVTTTSTPDVPSGGSFTTKCRTCITWAGAGRVQVVVTGAVEFTKSSWIKGQIEKGAAEGMATHYKELNTSIRKHIVAHPDQFGLSTTGEAGANPSPALSTNGAAQKETSSIRRRSHTLRKANGDRGSSQSSSTENSGAENGQPLKAASISTPDGSSKTGVWSNLMDSMMRNEGDNASHLALVAVLLLVMFANIYIWFQISSVTSQIEKIQGNVLGQRAGARAMYGSKGNGYYNRYMDYSSSGDDGYAREKEEAMWAWLTEREERYRHYQQTNSEERWNGEGKMDTTYDNSNDSNESKDGSARNSGFENPSYTETKLQARINELQQQLENLERALNNSPQGM